MRTRANRLWKEGMADGKEREHREQAAGEEAPRPARRQCEEVRR
jgi:hypothetical protein